METPLTSLAGMLSQALKLHSTFPALCWLVLNRLVFMPYLEARHWAGWWTGLEPASQAVLMVLLALFIGYTLDSLNFILLGLFETGGRSTWWGRLMIAWHKGQREQLEELAKFPRSDWESYEDELANHFPPAPDKCAPTALGNVLAAGKARIRGRYMIDVVNMWPRLMSVLSEKGYAAQVEREKANLNFFLNLSTLSVLFTIECVVARMLGWPGSALIPWAAVGMAYWFYRLAIPCAEKWYSWINAAFDLYRYQLAKRLALKPFKSADDELKHWWGLSRFIQGERETFEDFDYPLPKPKQTQEGKPAQ